MHKPFDYLHRVPAEIWTACWALCSLRQLRRISVVCHLFRSLSLPFLFRHQTLDLATVMDRARPDNWVDHFHHAHRMAVRLDCLAASSFPTLVRSWRVSLPSPQLRIWLSWRFRIKHLGLLDEMYDRVMTTFFTTFGLYRNISSLHIAIDFVDAALWETLRCLPLLETLHLYASGLDVGDPVIAASESRHDDRALPAASPWMLRRLHLADGHHLLTGFSAGELPHLMHLSIEYVDAIAPVVRFVEQCPRLESIGVHCLSRQSSPPWVIDVPLRSLPLLHTIVGPPCLVRSLAPNRRVHTVRVVSEKTASLDDLISLCTDISRSTVPVNTLALPPSTPTIEFLRRLILLHPDVRELCLGIVNPRHMEPLSVCHYHTGTPPKPECTVDERVPFFCDAEAFTCFSGQELSDDEAEDVPISIDDVVATEFRISSEPWLRHYIEDIIMWICDGLLHLPPNIESFRLELQYHTDLLLAQQHNALAALSGRYPLLREVQVGRSDTIWRREGSKEIWKAEGKFAVRIVRGRDRGSVED
ncbi:hypothetical protein MSAN_00472900 [Mycena sanguinolenta]|uniref:F-box domain-containing protein n=1 Tax=Mycena sanguinolenta TaxID=230812 RepID=A0A8H6ZHU7_9AGAR|nr:hypothetical protein MSAN_00472900 [Mycena sanguinolenta]